MLTLDRSIEMLKNAEIVADYAVPIAVSILIAGTLIIIGIFYLAAKLDKVSKDQDSSQNDKNNPAQ